MVDKRFIPAITATIRQNEIGNGSPYVLSFAKLGKSGASFGYMQGDTNVSDLARETLRKILLGSGADAAVSERIVASVSTALPDGDPLSPEDRQTVAVALAGDAGRRDVDAMDEQLLATVLAGLDAFLADAARGGVEVLPIVQLYVAPWVNMTGPPGLLGKWVQGATSHGVGPPIGTVTEGDIVAYLQATSYFAAHPVNFKHLHACVMVGAAKLPREGKS